ncbi:MAG: glycosyltransferase family 39 protein [Chloroflexi bacterium]|nr:glycosyltransferase family 39 protein [Chloroflexota bacterium]
MAQLGSPHKTLDNFIIPLGEHSLNVARVQLYQWVFWLLFIPVFIVGRAYNLNGMPIFVDEGTHIVWANRIMNTGQIMGFTDAGKTVHPLILAVLFSIFSFDQLWVARAFSVFTGLLAALGCYWLGKSLNNDWRVGMLTCLIYSLSPFTLFHDRIALADSLLTVLGIYTLIFSIKTVRSRQYKPAIVLGVLMGLATLTKLYGVVFIALPILTWLVLEKGSQLQRLWRVGGLAYLTALIVVSPQFLVAGALIDYMRGKTVKPWQPISMAELWQMNVNLSFTWLSAYLTPLILVLAFLGLLLAIRRKNPVELLVALVTVLGVLFFVLVSQRWYPRYLLIIVPGFYLLAASAIVNVSDGAASWVKRTKPADVLLVKWAGLAVPTLLFVIAAIQPLLFDYRMVTDLRTAPLVEVDRWQFVEGWPAGYGLPETAHYLKQKAEQEGGIIVVRHQELRVFLEGLEVYLQNEPKIELRTINFYEGGSLDKLQRIMAEQSPTYVAVEAPLEALPDLTIVPNMELVAKFEKPGGISWIEVYGPPQ